jgi:mono/diheme cytochrome c family protein
MRGAGAILVLLAAGALVAAAGDTPEASAPAAPAEPATKAARALFLARCSACHDPGRVYHRIAGPDEWRSIVDRMRRMPQAGISPREADVIVAYLVSLRGGAAAAPATGRVGGPEAYGPEWISVLEVATVREGAVRLGGKGYRVAVDGRAATVQRGGWTRRVALDEAGEVAETALMESWRIGTVAYEVHLVLYEIRDGRVRLGRALRRAP